LLGLLLLLLLALAGLASASAQSLSPGGPVDFGGVNVATTSPVTTLVFSVPAGDVVTVSSIIAVTEGAPNKDFAIPSQTCVGTIAGPATCNISVTFAPSALGLRLGELFVKDGLGNVSNHVPLRGAGLGPQMVVSPATAVAISSLTGIAPTAINPSSTVYDGAGNLYIDDALNGRILESTTSGSATLLASIPASTAAAPFSSIVLAGDGTLYVSSPNTATVYKIPPGGSPTPITTPGITLLQPAGLALDGFGYLYIADAGANQIVRVDAENGSAPTALTLTGLSTGLSSPQGVSVDAADNLYVADANNNRIVKIDLHTTVFFTNPATVWPISGLTLSHPAAVAVNSAGSLTVDDTGNNRLVELPLTGGDYAITLLNTTPPPTNFSLTTPAGLTLLPTGDLLVSDTVAGLVQVTRSTSSLTFLTSTLVGTVDSVDGDLALNVENTGSYVLQVAGNGFPSFSNNAFFADSTGTCPNTTDGTNGTQVPIGEVCTLEVGFKPTVAGPNTGTLNVSASGNGNVTATVNLTGTGFHILDHFTVTVVPSTVTPGQATSMTVTAINNDGTVDDTYAGTIVLSCTDPACVLPTGAYTFTMADKGIHTFASTLTPPLNFNTLGTWTVTVIDTTTKPGTTYTGTSNVVTVVTTPTVTLTSSVNPVLVGANTTLTATVSSLYGTPTGTVTFMDGATVLGTGTLNSSGVATLTVSFSTAGTHPLTVSYPGVGFFQAATSAVLNETVQTLGTTLGLASSVNPVNVNANTVLTATITSTSGTPTGTITFLDGATVLGTAPLSPAGVATLTVSFSTPGTHPLTASYPATGAYQAAISPVVNEIVQNFTSTATLTSSVNPALITNPTVLTATITSPAGPPTGTVTFFDGVKAIGTAILNSSGVATLNTTFTTNGQHILTVTYAGGGPYLPATSAPLTQVVEDFSLALATGSANSASIILGQSTQYNLVVSPIGATTLAAPVALTVSGLPSGGSGSFSPVSVPAAAGVTPVVLTVNAPPLTSSSLQEPTNPAHPFSRRNAPAFLALLLLPTGFLLRRRRAVVRLLVIFVGLAAATGLSGCLSDQATGYYGQMPETYTLTVTGTSGTLTHTVQVTLTVE
jgi:sugar lactone lactonase YvrE